MKQFMTNLQIIIEDVMKLYCKLHKRIGMKLLRALDLMTTAPKQHAIGNHLRNQIMQLKGIEDFEETLLNRLIRMEFMMTGGYRPSKIKVTLQISYQSGNSSTNCPLCK